METRWQSPTGIFQIQNDQNCQFLSNLILLLQNLLSNRNTCARGGSTICPWATVAFDPCEYTAAFSSLLFKQQRFDFHLAAFKLYSVYSSLLFCFVCYTAAFKLGLPYSSLWLPLSSTWYTTALGCLHAVIVIQQPLAAFKLYMFNKLPSNITQYTLAFGCFKLYLLYNSLHLSQSFVSYAFKLCKLISSL